MVLVSSTCTLHYLKVFIVHTAPSYQINKPGNKLRHSPSRFWQSKSYYSLRSLGMASPLSISISLFFAFLCSLSSFTAGTRKELRTKSVMNEPAIIQLVTSTQSTRLDPSRVIQLSWQPRIFLYRGFLSDEECDHLIYLAKGKLEISSVSDHGTKKTNNINPFTTLDIDQDEVVGKIENQISAWTFLPEKNGKHLQIMHYLPEKRTNQPHNYYGDEVEMDSGLMATVVLFLSNVTRGGEVLFPGSELKNTQVKDETWSDCSKEGYAINPVKGNALLFFNMQLSASPDNTSSHSTCPVLDGEKWCATKFFHVRAINENNFSSESNINGCTDEDDSCARWAALGECEKNPVYMIGSPDYYGSCRKSCNAC